MSTTADDLNDTLALVNVARMAFGKDVLTELPDSRPGASSDCLYYRALTSIGIGKVDGGGGMTCEDERQASYLSSIWGVPWEGGRTVRAPEQFKRVIGKFDREQLPHYNTHQKKHF